MCALSPSNLQPENLHFPGIVNFLQERGSHRTFNLGKDVKEISNIIKDYSLMQLKDLRKEAIEFNKSQHDKHDLFFDEANRIVADLIEKKQKKKNIEKFQAHMKLAKSDNPDERQEQKRKLEKYRVKLFK